MRRSKTAAILVVFLLVLTYVVINSSSVSAAVLLAKGQSGSQVRQLQDDLKKLGYFSANSTGYYGDITFNAVKRYQSGNGLVADGIAGSKTLASISSKISSLYYNNTLLKIGMRSSAVTRLQEDLKKLGYFQATPTGYFGTITKNAVQKLQKDQGLTVDGIAGKNTFAAIEKILAGGTSGSSSGGSSGGGSSAISSSNTANTGSSGDRSSADRASNYLMPWFNGVENIFKRGSVATVYDINSGISFKVKRTYGTNHADCEPLTADDTAAMKKAYGGAWSWERRAIIVKVNGYEFAASMNGMPHAGLESKPEGAYVSGRAGGFGYGYNYDSIKGNNFDGHFCIHFLNSRTHGSNKVDPDHSKMIQAAARWLESN